MVAGEQVLGVGGRERVRGQVCRATGRPRCVVHARRPRFDLSWPATGPQKEAVERYRGTNKETWWRSKPTSRHYYGQRILQTRIKYANDLYIIIIIM